MANHPWPQLDWHPAGIDKVQRTTEPQHSVNSFGKRRRSQSESSETREDQEESLFITDDDDDDNDDEASDSDDSKGSGEDDPIDIKWAEDQESYPPVAIYHPDLSAIFERLLAMACSVHTILKTGMSKHRALGMLKAKVVDVETFPWPEPMKIALLGDVGAGKIKSTLRDSQKLIPSRKKLSAQLTP